MDPTSGICRPDMFILHSQNWCQYLKEKFFLLSKRKKWNEAKWTIERVCSKLSIPTTYILFLGHFSQGTCWITLSALYPKSACLSPNHEIHRCSKIRWIYILVGQWLRPYVLCGNDTPVHMQYKEPALTHPSGHSTIDTVISISKIKTLKYFRGSCMDLFPIYLATFLWLNSIYREPDLFFLLLKITYFRIFNYIKFLCKMIGKQQKCMFLNIRRNSWCSRK